MTLKQKIGWTILGLLGILWLIGMFASLGWAGFIVLGIGVATCLGLWLVLSD